VPLTGAVVGADLPETVGLLVLARLLTAGTYLVLCLRIFPGGRRPSVDRTMAGPLFSFGGWIMAANLAGLVLVEGDRLLIPSLISTAALTFYSIPQDVAARLWVLPASVASALFPAFGLAAGPEDTRVARLYADAVLYLLLAFVPAVSVVLILGETLLRWWMGPEFAAQATLVLQVSTVGVFLDALARIPLTYLQATGHPALPARFRMGLVVPYLLAAAGATLRWGILGAAWVWTGRILVETILLFAATHRGGRILLPPEVMPRMRRGFFAGGLTLAGTWAVVWAAPKAVGTQVVLATVILVAFLVNAWSSVDVAHRAKLRLLVAGADR
jgi:O-antigen/teichoic acid export membrane protein